MELQKYNFRVGIYTTTIVAPDKSVLADQMRVYTFLLLINELIKLKDAQNAEYQIKCWFESPDKNRGDSDESCEITRG